MQDQTLSTQARMFRNNTSTQKSTYKLLYKWNSITNKYYLTNMFNNVNLVIFPSLLRYYLRSKEVG